VSAGVLEAPVTYTRRGTSNKNERGSSYSRRSRRAWIVLTYASNVPGYCRCYRCGMLLFNPDAEPDLTDLAITLYGTQLMGAQALTVDRIIPGCQGGTYRRNNIRPACGGCNSETGGALASRGRKV
jgi:hypothetical protein